MFTKFFNMCFLNSEYNLWRVVFLLIQVMFYSTSYYLVKFWLLYFAVTFFEGDWYLFVYEMRKYGKLFIALKVFFIIGFICTWMVNVFCHVAETFFYASYFSRSLKYYMLWLLFYYLVMMVVAQVEFLQFPIFLLLVSWILDPLC